MVSISTVGNYGLHYKNDWIMVSVRVSVVLITTSINTIGNHAPSVVSARTWSLLVVQETMLKSR